MNGIRATHAILENYPDIAVLVLTTYDADEWVTDAIRVGVVCYLLKDASREEIIEEIEGTLAGRTQVDPAVTNRLSRFVRNGAQSRSSIAKQFSERELAVLRLLANGLSNADIATCLHLAEGTVRNHVTNILAKLEVTDSAQATAVAWKYGLATTNERRHLNQL